MQLKSIKNLRKLRLPWSLTRLTKNRGVGEIRKLAHKTSNLYLCCIYIDLMRCVFIFSWDLNINWLIIFYSLLHFHWRIFGSSKGENILFFLTIWKNYLKALSGSEGFKLALRGVRQKKGLSGIKLYRWMIFFLFLLFIYEVKRSVKL